MANSKADFVADHDPGALARLCADLADHLRECRPLLARAQSAASLRRPPGSQPLRALLLDALADLGYPTTSRTLGAFVAARYGRQIAAAQFGTLAGQERRAFARGGAAARAVWLASGLTPTDFHPVKRVWGRSDWPIEWRIMTPTSSRLQHLHATDSLCRLAANAETEAVDPEALRQLALAHARDLPGVAVETARPTFSRYARVAQALLDEIEPQDQPEREHAARLLAGQPEKVRLFGIEEESRSQARPRQEP